ncbi:long-chain-fatty-acid--CoA ligase ACSBG2-like [Rhopilema esculentum]|uniref:long-chain-fatty-acid--CoA ligase ACSBG2-like n=1 Tax=Rhopilema esculentum TaxID=499914 RepID=UPI0031CE80C9
MASESEPVDVQDIHVHSAVDTIKGVEEKDMDNIPDLGHVELVENKQVNAGENEQNTEETTKTLTNGDIGEDSGEANAQKFVVDVTPSSAEDKGVESSASQDAKKEVEAGIFETRRDGGVKIKVAEGERKPQTVIEVFDATCQAIPNQPGLKEEKDGKWVTWTYKEYHQDVQIAAKAFIKLGLEPYNAVGIIGFNSPEWMISDLGAIYACGLAAGIYTTSTPDACLFIAADAQVNILVAENDVQVQKFLKIWDKLPSLKAIIQYKGELKEKMDNVYTWNEIMDMGRQCDDEALKQRMAMAQPNKCCTLIYTSGTTGNPKGVMLSHDNVIYGAYSIVDNIIHCFDMSIQQCGVSYLPLSHIAAQMSDLYGPILLQGYTAFAKPDALKGSLGATLKAVRPTLFFGVPRVFEKIEERMKAIGQNITGFRKKVANWAKDVSLRGNINIENGHSTPFGFSIASAVLKKIRVQLGLDRCRLIYTGAAPVSLETLRYFQSINIPLLELYGMSECTGLATLSVPKLAKTTAVGRAIKQMEMKIFNEDEDGSGEICMRGRGIFMGYLGNKEKTEESIDSEGWLHSGDVGKFDKDGFMFITGRIKELIITAGGENIAPVPIEERIKAELPFISNAMVIGDKRKFLSVLLTPKVEMCPDSGDALEALASQSVTFCKSLGIDVTKVDEIAPSPPQALDEAIKAGITKANANAVSNAAKVQKYHLLATDFSIPGGELGPTLKLRRPHVYKKYKDEIEGLYQ